MEEGRGGEASLHLTFSTEQRRGRERNRKKIEKRGEEG